MARSAPSACGTPRPWRPRLPRRLQYYHGDGEAAKDAALHTPTELIAATLCQVGYHNATLGYNLTLPLTQHWSTILAVVSSCLHKLTSCTRTGHL